MAKEIRVSLGHDDFAKLVRGQIIECKVVGFPDHVLKVALQDIGFVVMADEVAKATDELFARQGEKSESQGGS